MHGAVPLCPEPPPATIVRAGFTLIELLIAIASMAVLAAIAVPSYQSYYD